VKFSQEHPILLYGRVLLDLQTSFAGDKLPELANARALYNQPFHVHHRFQNMIPLKLFLPRDGNFLLIPAPVSLPMTWVWCPTTSPLAIQPFMKAFTAVFCFTTPSIFHKLNKYLELSRLFFLHYDITRFFHFCITWNLKHSTQSLSVMLLSPPFHYYISHTPLPFVLGVPVCVGLLQAHCNISSNALGIMPHHHPNQCSNNLLSIFYVIPKK